VVDPEENDPMTTGEAARYLGVSAGLIRRWIYRGELDAWKAGRDLWVDLSSAQTLRERRLKSPPRRGRPRKEGNDG